MKKLIILLTLSLASCSNSISSDTVSLLDYTTPSELSSLGYTPDKVEETNRTIESYFGYNRYDGYSRYKINNFEIITNPNDPDELYVVKDGDFLVSMKQPNTVKLYKQGTTFPNRADTSVYFDRSQPMIMIADDNQLYFDIGLNGVDVVYEKDMYEGAEEYMNYVDILPLPSYENVIGANVPGQQCEKLVGPFACCLDGKQIYQPYSFNSEIGWKASDSKKAQERCNVGN